MRCAVQPRLTPINVRCQVPQDRYVSGASLHPQEGFELATSPPRQEFISSSLISTTQGHYAISIRHHIVTLENKAVPRGGTRIPTCESGYILQFRVQLHPSEDKL
jgi:hypothetical protein